MATIPYTPGLHPSSVGEVRDVGTPASWKGCLLGLFWLLMTVPSAFFAGAAVLIVYWEVERGKQELTGMMIPMGIVAFVITWVLVATAVRRFRAAFQAGRYFRAGPNGFSVRVPAGCTLASLMFGSRSLQFDVPIYAVKTW